jgi:hypothetical protein
MTTLIALAAFCALVFSVAALAGVAEAARRARSATDRVTELAELLAAANALHVRLIEARQVTDTLRDHRIRELETQTDGGPLGKIEFPGWGN